MAVDGNFREAEKTTEDFLIQQWCSHTMHFSAAIATEAKVVKKLKELGIDKYKLSGSFFLFFYYKTIFITVDNNKI